MESLHLIVLYLNIVAKFLNQNYLRNRCFAMKRPIRKSSNVEKISPKKQQLAKAKSASSKPISTLLWYTNFERFFCKNRPLIILNSRSYNVREKNRLRIRFRIKGRPHLFFQFFIKGKSSHENWIGKRRGNLVSLTLLCAEMEDAGVLSLLAYNKIAFKRQEIKINVIHYRERVIDHRYNDPLVLKSWIPPTATKVTWFRDDQMVRGNVDVPQRQVTALSVGKVVNDVEYLVRSSLDGSPFRFLECRLIVRTFTFLVDYDSISGLLWMKWTAPLCFVPSKYLLQRHPPVSQYAKLADNLWRTIQIMEPAELELRTNYGREQYRYRLVAFQKDALLQTAYNAVISCPRYLTTRNHRNVLNLESVDGSNQNNLVDATSIERNRYDWMLTDPQFNFSEGFACVIGETGLIPKTCGPWFERANAEIEATEGCVVDKLIFFGGCPFPKVEYRRVDGQPSCARVDVHPTLSAARFGVARATARDAAVYRLSLSNRFGDAQMFLRLRLVETKEGDRLPVQSFDS